MREIGVEDGSENEFEENEDEEFEGCSSVGVVKRVWGREAEQPMND